jgi:DNA-binding response OmpR family regulator
MTDAIRTLVVDDDESIRFFLSQTLRNEGHIVTLASNGEEALERLRETRFDLTILDLKLGGRIDGLRVLEAVNWRWPRTAKIMLTGHATLDSAIAAIHENVDAYLLKPVRAHEVRQIVKEVLARQSKSQRIEEPVAGENLLHQGPFSVDLDRRVVEINAKPKDLTDGEFNLLVHLVRNAHRVVPPSELVKAVRGYECDHVQEARDIIKWYVHRLRRKVEPNPSRPRHILNVRGVGYTFKE